MSSDEAEAIQSYYADKDAKKARHDFLNRMEHKLNRKERLNRS